MTHPKLAPVPSPLPLTAVVPRKTGSGQEPAFCGLKCEECGTELRVPSRLCGLCGLELGFEPDEAA